MLKRLGMIAAFGVPLCAVLLGGSVAVAQGEEASQKVLDVLTVTARKRIENVQDVPLAVTNVTGAFLAVAKTEDLVEVQKFLPNVELEHSPVAGGGLYASVRGIGFADNRKTFEPTVGVSLDGVFLGSNSGAALEMFDIESIQVLRGPQGTLFGRNTTGGSIVITRSRPTGEFGVRAGFLYGRYNRFEENVVLNLPKFGDAVSVKLYAFKKDSDSFQQQAATGKHDKEEDSLQFGGAILFEPSDDFEALLSIDYVDDKMRPTRAVSLTPGSQLFCAVLTRILFADTPFSENGCRSTSFDASEATGFKTAFSEFPNLNTLKGWSGTLEMTWDTSDNITLTSVTGYRDHDEKTAGNVVGDIGLPIGVGGTLAPISEFAQDTTYEQFSQELRMNAEIWDRLDLVVGLYYFHSKFDFSPGRLLVSDIIGTQTSFGALGRNQFSSQSVDAYAAFIDGIYRVTDRFRISAGVRLSYEKKKFSNAVDIGSQDPGGVPFDVSASDSWTEPSWRVSFDYDLTDDVMAYVSWARGFRSGGFNARALSTAQTLEAFEPETVDTIEVGTRMEFADGTIRVNPTIFYTSYRDKQEEVLISVGGATAINTQIIFNASKVEYFGAELEIDASITDDLTFRGALGYLDSEVKTFLIQDPTTTVPMLIDDSAGRQVRGAPKWTISAGLQYNFHIGNSGEVTLFGLYSWKDESFTESVADGIPEFDLDKVGSYGSADFSITYTPRTGNADSEFSISAFVKDAFDSRRGRAAVVRNIAGTFAFGFLQPTTTWGIELKVDL